MNVYLDTNIFIALIEGPDAALREAIWKLFSLDEQKMLRLLTSELSIAELLVKPFELQLDALASAYLDMLQPEAGRISVVPIDRDILIAAAQVRSLDKSIRLPDAIHFATADHENCKIFLTADHALAQKRPNLCRPLSAEGVEAIVEQYR